MTEWKRICLLMQEILFDPDQGRSQMPGVKISLCATVLCSGAWEQQLLSPCDTRASPTTPRATSLARRSLCSEKPLHRNCWESPCSLQLGRKVHAATTIQHSQNKLKVKTNQENILENHSVKLVSKNMFFKAVEIRQQGGTMFSLKVLFYLICRIT